MRTFFVSVAEIEFGLLSEETQGISVVNIVVLNAAPVGFQSHTGRLVLNCYRKDRTEELRNRVRLYQYRKLYSLTTARLQASPGFARHPFRTYHSQHSQRCRLATSR